MARIQIRQLEATLEFYKLDNGYYPTTTQGLAALVSKPKTQPIPSNYAPNGYLAGGRVPLDPWGLAYHYRSPGTHDPSGFDLWSLGADGAAGGTGADADIGSWQEPIPD